MKTALRSLVVLVAVLLSGAAPAETWPTRPIKFVVQFGPGIGIDIMARTVADRLSHKLGQPVIVENIPGAGNILGAQAVARAAPDGYTFLFTGPSPVVTNIFAFKSLPYDPYRDFTAVQLLEVETVYRDATVLRNIESAPKPGVIDLTKYAPQKR